MKQVILGIETSGDWSFEYVNFFEVRGLNMEYFPNSKIKRRGKFIREELKKG